jgi:hypothetical protein
MSIEQEACEDYLRRSADEEPLARWARSQGRSATLIVSEGFEERSCGAVEVFANAGVIVPKVIIGRYQNADDVNTRYRERLERLAEAVAPGNWQVLHNLNDGAWVADAVAIAETDTLLFDITGVSNRAMFRALDRLVESGRTVYVAYTEAQQYWPKWSDWKKLRKQLSAYESLAELVDKKPWLFSYEHRVELVPGHEGYDAAGTGRALVAFLPFKCARLAAVLEVEDYAEMLFIAGRPPVPQWRLKALGEINDALTKGSRVVEMSTFGYRSTIRGLMDLLFCGDSPLYRYDVHFAAIGSKLQTVGSWAFSCAVPSLTVITSVPTRYYREAFSEGVGTSWTFRLTHM